MRGGQAGICSGKVGKYPHFFPLNAYLSPLSYILDYPIDYPVDYPIDYPSWLGINFRAKVPKGLMEQTFLDSVKKCTFN